MAIRAIRGYRTVSHAAATLLAGFPPLHIVAGMHAQVFHGIRRARLERNVDYDAFRVETRMRREAAARLMEEWRDWLTGPELNGLRVREALEGRLEEWTGRGWGYLTYRLTQVMTGHGCFGQYLCRIGRDPNPSCSFCSAECDDAQHTLAECASWDMQRLALKDVVGEDLSLPTLAGLMLEREEAWTAVAGFCDTVMRAKEEAERVRRGEGPRAGRGGRRAPRRGRARVARRRRQRMEGGSDSPEGLNRCIAGPLIGPPRRGVG